MCVVSKPPWQLICILWITKRKKKKKKTRWEKEMSEQVKLSTKVNGSRNEQKLCWLKLWIINTYFCTLSLSTSVCEITCVQLFTFFKMMTLAFFSPISPRARVARTTHRTAAAAVATITTHHFTQSVYIFSINFLRLSGVLLSFNLCSQSGKKKLFFSVKITVTERVLLWFWIINDPIYLNECSLYIVYVYVCVCVCLLAFWCDKFHYYTIFFICVCTAFARIHRMCYSTFWF